MTWSNPWMGGWKIERHTSRILAVQLTSLLISRRSCINRPPPRTEFADDSILTRTNRGAPLRGDLAIQYTWFHPHKRASKLDENPIAYSNFVTKMSQQTWHQLNHGLAADAGVQCITEEGKQKNQNDAADIWIVWSKYNVAMVELSLPHPNSERRTSNGKPRNNCFVWAPIRNEWNVNFPPSGGCICRNDRIRVNERVKPCLGNYWGSPDSGNRRSWGRRAVIHLCIK